MTISYPYYIVYETLESFEADEWKLHVKGVNIAAAAYDIAEVFKAHESKGIVRNVTVRTEDELNAMEIMALFTELFMMDVANELKTIIAETKQSERV